MPGNPMQFVEAGDGVRRMLARNILVPALEEELPAEAVGRYAAQECMGGKLWLLEVDGAGIATVGVRPVAGREGLWEVFGLAVSRAWRRGGLAAFMLDRVCQELREKGGTHLLARLDQRLAAAGAFFAKYGFRQTVAPDNRGEYVLAYLLKVRV